MAVFNSPAGWFALDDACPHRGGPLSDGLLADACVACPLHDRRFQLDGGRSLSEDCGDVDRPPLPRSANGRVYVELAGALAEAA